MAIKKCTCVSEYQDKKYGKKMRVMNNVFNGKSFNAEKFRCTVCNQEK